MTTNAQPNNTPIAATNVLFNPIFGYLQSNLASLGLTQNEITAFTTGVMKLINDSPLLIEQINDLASTKNWQIQYLSVPDNPSEDKGQTGFSINNPGTGAIRIYINTAAIGNSATLQGAINDFVGTLAYEIAHAEDLQYNTITYGGNELAAGARTALALLSESKSVYNNIIAASAISSAAGQIITQDGSSSAISDEKNDIGTFTTALLLGAGDVANGFIGGTDIRAISNYWDENDSSPANSDDTTGADQTVVAALQSMDSLSNATTVVTQNANGTLTMRLTNITYSGDSSILFNGTNTSVSAYSDTFGNYGTVMPSGIAGGQANPVQKTPSPLGVTTSQTFDFAAGGSLVDSYNPVVDSAQPGNPILVGVAEEVANFAGSSGSGTATNIVYTLANSTQASLADNIDPLLITTAATGTDTVTYTASQQSAGSTTYGINASNATLAIGNYTSATVTGTGNTISVGSNDNVILAAPSGSSSTVTNDIIIGAGNPATAPNDLTTDTLTFEGNSIAGAIDPSTFDKFGRSYSLSGTTLTITGKTGGDQLTINNFVNGDFGVTLPYTFTPFTVPGASSVDLRGISSNGKLLAGTDSNGAFSDNGGTFTTIAVPSKSQPNYLNPGYFHPAGVNDSGEIVGANDNRPVLPMRLGA